MVSSCVLELESGFDKFHAISELLLLKKALLHVGRAINFEKVRIVLSVPESKLYAVPNWFRLADGICTIVEGRVENTDGIFRWRIYQSAKVGIRRAKLRVGRQWHIGFIAYIVAGATGKEQRIPNLVAEIRWPQKAVVQLRLSSALMALARL